MGGTGSLDDETEGPTLAAPSAPLRPDESRIAVGDCLGRYSVRGFIGAGGMGEVYEGYDPELERSVALKVLKVAFGGTSPEARARFQREAHAMARLNHPNVVAVYDVGTVGERVFVAMELVHGPTLAEWINAGSHSWREVVDVFLHAGRGLSAAHAAGIVHRDFKPHNVILGDRVRVADFGLARAFGEVETDAAPSSSSTLLDNTVTRTGQALGTPRYMAPEQRWGEAVTAQADQYAFGAALWEGLCGSRPFAGTSVAALAEEKRALKLAAPARRPPRWALAVARRALCPAPADRFPSMNAVIAALERGLRRRLWGITAATAIALVLGVGAIAFVAGARRAAERVAPCGGAEAKLAATFGTDARTAAFARIAGINAYGRTLPSTLGPALADHAARWSAGYRDACLAHRSGAQSDALLDRRMACLERGRAALGAVADVVEHADADALPGVVQAVRALPDPAECADLDGLLSDLPPPPPSIADEVARLRGELEAARVEIAADRLVEGETQAAHVVARARILGYRPLAARALLTHGVGMMQGDEFDAGVAVLREAWTIALETGDDPVAVEAWARRAYCQGFGTHGQASALDGHEVVEALAQRPSVGRYARALLYREIGMVEDYADHADAARAALTRAVVESRGLTGSSAIEFLSARANLALLSPDHASADALFAQVIAEKTRLLGAEHPSTLATRAARGRITLTALADAEAYLAPTCEALELHARLAVTETQPCWGDVGFLRAELGDRRGAIAALERASRIGGPAGPDGPNPEVEGYLALWRGDAAGAAAYFVDQLAAEKQELGWQRANRALLALGLGRARRALGDLPGARAALETAILGLEDALRAHPGLSRERRLTRARAELAYVLEAQGAARAEILPLAAQAAASLRRMSGVPAEIARLDALARP
jgi:predicted Ser/Thr protein kinase